MERENEQYGLDQFETVWARVCDTETETESLPPMQPAEAVLAAMIEAEVESIAAYTTLLRRVGGNTGQILTKIANQEREHLRRLELELFLCSGDIKHYTAPARQSGGILTDLRGAYVAEQQASQRYQLAYATALQPELRTLYGTLAKEEAQHAETLRCIIGKMMV